jgi:hypothetical protein
MSRAPLTAPGIRFIVLDATHRASRINIHCHYPAAAPARWHR